MSILWFVFHNSLYLHAKIIDQQGELHSQIPDELWTKAREYVKNISSLSLKNIQTQFFQKEAMFKKATYLQGLKLCNQVPSLDYLVVQNSGDFFC